MRKFWTPLRLVSTLIVFTVFAAFVVSSCNSYDERTASPLGPNSNTAASTAPAKTALPGLNILPANVRDVELRAASGAPIKLSNYSGKVLLVNLWATWCGPCRSEIPELVKLHKEFQSRGVEMVGLSTEDPDDSAEAVRNFVREYKVDYPIGWATREVTIALMQGNGSIPQSFIITRDGRILKRFIGFSPVATPPQLRQALEDALKYEG